MHAGWLSGLLCLPKRVARGIPAGSLAVLTSTFLVAAIMKLSRFSDFAATIRSSYLLPPTLAVPVAAMVIAVEFWAALGMWLPRQRHGALIALCGLCWTFFWYNVWKLIGHVRVPCSCFGALLRMPPPAGAALDIALLGLAGLALRHYRQPIMPHTVGRTQESGDAGRAWAYASLAALTTALLIGASLTRPTKPAPRPAAVQPVSASPATVIGQAPTYRGAIDAPYTLVEFADYQCPACRQIGSQIDRVLREHPGQLRLTYRNLPLVAIHPLAYGAAVAAEAAREQGKFWAMHDGLYTVRPDSYHITSLARSLGLDMRAFRSSCATTAQHAVAADLQATQVLGVSETPTFMLCCPDGRVLKLDSLRDVKGLVAETRLRASQFRDHSTTPSRIVGGVIKRGQ